MPEREEEPTIQPEPSQLEDRVNHVLERAAGVLTSVVAALLVVFVVVALMGVLTRAAKPLAGRDYSAAAHEGLDAAFLAIILLELVHTTLSRGSITRQLQEFLVIGVTAGVRSGLEVAAGAREKNPREIVTNLAINALGVLVLVVALWLVRQRLHVERSDPKGADS
jgi:phosphate starvation-inducible membrane PsiE